jgi:general stress protein 26
MPRAREGGIAQPIPHKKTRGTASVPERLKALDKTQRHAVLATDSDGQPFTSLVAFALLQDLSGIVFATPKDTAKYRNIMKNKRVALLIDTRSNRESSYTDAEAITIVGIAKPARRGRRWKALSEAFTKKHPRLSRFVADPSTALVLVEIARCFHVGQFQKISKWSKG